MTMTTAAFYIPNDNIVAKKVNEEASEKSRGMLLSALKNQHTEIQNFDLKKMCDNLTLQGKVEFVQRYATGALTKIINGQPITCKTMLDSLFNTYAPAINASLAKSGYNSVMAMKDAAAHGTINASSFLGAFNSGLIAVEETSKSNTLFEKYGEEIPIDVVEKCEYEYKNITAKRKTQENEEEEYIKPIENVIIKLTGHVKNKNAELWDMNDFSYKLADAMAAQKEIVMRIGKTIYDGVILVEYNPVVTNIHEIKFSATVHLKYQYGNKSTPFENDFKVITNEGSMDLKNLKASTEYIGPSLVEPVTKKDTILIAAIKKFTGQESIRIDGEYV